MRDIKFRAWDKFNEEMFPKKFEDDFLVKFFRDVNERRNGGNEIIIMQFTGLKDKNGKEIYEGDILRYSFGIPGIPGISGNAEVVFKECAFYALTPEHKPKECALSEFFEHLPDSEIVGNIYENPELIQDQ